jgi:hypothetical protein
MADSSMEGTAAAATIENGATRIEAVSVRHRS